MGDRSDRRRLVGIVAAALVAAALVACGSDATLTGVSAPVTPVTPQATDTATMTTTVSDPSTSTAPVASSWTRQRLDSEPGPDQPMLFESSGDQTIVIVPPERGHMVPWRSQSGGPFEQGEAIDTGMEYVFPSTAVRTGDGWLALMYDGTSYEVGTLRSPDGLRWTAGVASGFGPAAEPREIIATDGGFVAVGTVRTAKDPHAEGFRPMAWRSADGDTWSATSLPLPAASTDEATASGVLAVDGELLAVGRSDARGVMWSSFDGGTSWEITERAGIPATYELRHIVATGGVILASGLVPSGDQGDGSESEAVLVRSTDAGRTWSVAAQPPPTRGDHWFPLPVAAGNGQFLALNSFFPDVSSDPELCYADVERCQGDTDTTLYVSVDGDRWRRVDSSGIKLGRYSDIGTMMIDDAGRVVVLALAAGGVDAWSWPAGASLPTSPDPQVPKSDVPILGHGETLPPDRRYGYPLYIHCGMEWLYQINGTAWRRTDNGPDIETGAGNEPPADWPVSREAVFGFVTLVEDDVIEYSIGDGQVIATYAPSPTDAPGCD